MDLSIIIVNYNTLPVTAACIERIFSITEGIDFEVILVDNSSTDGSCEHFSADSRITYIYNHENLGFGRANNLGLRRAQGRNILFLNPDTLLLNNAAAMLSHYLDAHKNVAAVGGNLYNEEMRPALSFRRFRPSVVEELDTLLFHLPQRIFAARSRFFNHTSYPIEVGYISGADLMARRQDLIAIGGFDEEFFMYYEDTDLCHRLAQKGGRILSIPSIRIQHLEGKSFYEARLNRRRIILSEQGRHLYYAKNHGRRYHITANAIYLLSLRLHGVYYKLSNQRVKYRGCLLRRTIVSHLQKGLKG